MPYLSEIENPKQFMMKVAYFFSRKIFGKVIMPMKVIYARNPALLKVTMKITKILEKNMSISSEMTNLISAQSSLLNGCSFCRDLHLAEAMKLGIGTDKFNNLHKFRESDAFSPKEKAMLVFTEKITREKTMTLEVIEDLKKHFSERQIVDIIWANAVGNYFNLLSLPLDIVSDNLSSLAKSEE
ncbi:carboxymuconolactone decarboxylase family protein [bacterium]|nr:carboxymuconolactone decarboxylase family protein [bacterium]